MNKDKIEHKEVAKEQYEEAVKGVLLHTFMQKDNLEKRMPTREELEKKWKLERKE